MYGTVETTLPTSKIGQTGDEEEEKESRDKIPEVNMNGSESRLKNIKAKTKTLLPENNFLCFNSRGPSYLQKTQAI